MNLLITKNDLIESCALSENTNDEQVNIAIQQAQNKLQSIVCKDFYGELRSQFLAGKLTVANALFLNSYVKLYLIWEAYANFTVVGSFSQTTAGFREQIGDNSQPVDGARINMIKKNAEEQSLFYRNEMMNFINDNIDDYATYKASDCYGCYKRHKPGFKISGAGSKQKQSHDWYYPGYSKFS